MEPQKVNDSAKLSKEEMARRISGSVAARSNDEMRQDVERSTAPRQRPPYPSAQPKKSSSSAGAKKKSSKGTSKASRAKQKKKKRRQRIILTIVVLVLVLLILAVVAVVFWYTNGKAQYNGVFLDNTFINGTEVSGYSAEEAAQLVRQDTDIPDAITITKSDGEDVVIKIDDIGGEDNILDSVASFYYAQDHSQWYTAKSSETKYTFTVEYDFDRDELHSEINRRIVEGESSDVEPENAYIQRTDDGFEIVEEVLSEAIDADKVDTLYDYVDGFLDRGEYSINISSCDCYTLPEITSLDLQDELDKLNSLYDIEFTFDFTYTTETLEGSEVIDWITFDNDNPLDGYTVDEDKAMEYVEKLAEKYDTYGMDRTFNSTTRGEITVEQGEGDYGWWIDQAKTCALIVDMIEEGISAETEPIYYVNPNSQYTYTCNEEWRTEDSDIGDTYCEVDLEEQHFWYYEDGELAYECDIVSGKPTEARNTPAGVYKIWYKELNKTLTGTTSAGESWSTPVTYWNNISTFGVGLHDATWQSSFGGTRYVNYGSHGCINMPYDAAKYVYENIDYDTPVVMYW